MSKTEFVAAVAGSQDLSKQAAHEAMDAVVTALAQALIDGESLTLPGLGTFSLKERAPAPGAIQLPVKSSRYLPSVACISRLR